MVALTVFNRETNSIECAKLTSIDVNGVEAALKWKSNGVNGFEQEK